MCSELLSTIKVEVEATHQFVGLKINPSAPSISHLMFADDLLFFRQITLQNAQTVKHILKDYETITGQSVNFEKSSIYMSPSMDPVMKTLITELLGVKQMKGSGTWVNTCCYLHQGRILIHNL